MSKRCDELRFLIGEEASVIQKKLDAYDGDTYMVLATHSYTQGMIPNLVIVPSDKRFDDVEFMGMIVDVFRNYLEHLDLERQEEYCKVMSHVFGKVAKEYRALRKKK